MTQSLHLQPVGTLVNKFSCGASWVEAWVEPLHFITILGCPDYVVIRLAPAPGLVNVIPQPEAQSSELEP